MNFPCLMTGKLYKKKKVKDHFEVVNLNTCVGLWLII